MNNNSIGNISGEKKILGLQYSVRCMHKDYLTAHVMVDFAELWIGSSLTKSASAKNWLGNFEGRPKLATEIFEVVKHVAETRRPQAIRSLLHELRSFWRYLEAYEKSFEGEEGLAKIDRLEKIDTLHGIRWLTPLDKQWDAARPEKYRSIHSILQSSRRAAGLPPLYWPPAKNPDRINRADVPSRKQGITLIKILARRARLLWKRWDDSDEMAKTGRSLLGISRAQLFAREVSEEDIHATYREIIRITNDPTPDLSTVAKVIGFKLPLPRWWPKKKPGHPREGRAVNIEDDLLPGLYPTTEDLHCLASLFMARSGWNPTTLFALNCTADEEWFRPYGDDLTWLYSYKERGGNWQDTVSPKDHATHCFQIVHRLLNRTRALRDELRQHSNKCKYPEIAERTPWLCADNSKSIRVLSSHSLNAMRSFLVAIIEGYNLGVSSDEVIPIFKPSDFRDVFAEAVHRGGNYSVFLTQIALGHTSSRSTRRYLRSVAWRKESEEDLNSLVSNVLHQVEVHRVIDFTILRATMDGLNVTQEQINRLEVYRNRRTYSGLGCKTPTDPPEWIDPQHPHDDKTFCAQGHRCASCPRGVVFKDSLPQLAKCLAELEWKRANVGDVRWYESSESMDMDVIEATLEQWPAEQVSQALSTWRVRISQGEHRVLINAAGIH
ncbi:hypothetical protein [Pseudomonas putida]|uniref:hypothetical protein n=1 Tax=Pseudomonas putida TaxID=303 RepID=UPI0022DD11C5|nr:hypothetical protein [Pseudomonas putida]WBM48010.1 hypothetical protein M2J85_07025 [Pseudomonas putida]